MKFKTGNVVLIGEPNVGKSSIVNKIVGEQVSVVTDIPGTTREQIKGIKTGDDYQIIFLDTPGMHKAKTSLDKFMSKSISHAMRDADVVLYVLDATDIKDEYIQKIRNYDKTDKPMILVINKTDRSNMQKLYPKLAELNALEFVKAIIPTSCKDGENIAILEAEIVKHLPEGEPQFEKDDFTTSETRKMAEEIIRGELLKMLQRELPHGIAVKIIEWKQQKREVEIKAEIYCVKPSHKPMIIGKKGAVLKQVGINARKQIEELTGMHVKLYTHVLVREGWKDKKDMLDKLGYMH